MKGCIILVHTFLLVIMLQSLYGQENCSCNYAGKINSEPVLSGELFESDQPLDAITWFNNKWLSGDIFLPDGEIASNKQIKYNGLLDELFWLEPKSKNTIKLDKEAIRKFCFLNLQGIRSVCFEKIKVKRDVIADSSEIFGQVIYHGNLSLFVLYTIVVERRQHFYKDNVPYQKNIYTAAPIYYFRFINNKTIGIKRLNRKSLYAFSPDNKEQIKKFFRENNQGKFKNHSELIRLTQFLNTIVNQ